MSEIRILSVLIVSWNGRRHLEQCLPVLENQAAGCGLETEVLVLDNGSTDGTVDWISREFPRVRVIASPENLGFAVANNRLVREARGDVVLLLNNDTRPEPGMLSGFAEGWRAAPSDVAALAGRLIDWEGERLDFGRGVATFDGHAFALDQGRRLDAARIPEAGEELLFGCGGNLLVRRSSFLEAGGFDEHYFAYFEDVDLGWRLWAGGERVLACPDACARHRLGASSSRLGDSKRGAMFERNALLTVAKNLEDGLRERLLPAVLLTFLSRLRWMGEIPAAGPRGRRARVAGILQRLADRIARRPPSTLRFPHPQAPAQLGGLAGFLEALEPLGAERVRLAARRRRADREIFARFPLWIVPTYPGDEALFTSPAFASWLPSELRFERAALDEVVERS